MCRINVRIGCSIDQMCAKLAGINNGIIDGVSKKRVCEMIMHYRCIVIETKKIRKRNVLSNSNSTWNVRYSDDSIRRSHQ
jgi:hypothetical protein